MQLSGQLKEALDLKNFFPVGCDYYWDGKGQIPLASQMLKVMHASIANVCSSCPKTDCPVRIVKYQPTE